VRDETKARAIAQRQQDEDATPYEERFGSCP
jgi:hypothetical protein